MKIGAKQLYRHFKGGIYEIVCPIAEHTETGESLVVYRRRGHCKIYVRPYAMFSSKVDKEKYPNATQEYRFELIDQGETNE